MPGVDLVTRLGTARWTATDAERLFRVQQRARFDLSGVASERALAGDIAGGNAETKNLVDNHPSMRGWVVVNPLYPERSSEDMRRYLGSSKWLGAMLDPTRTGERLASATTRELLTAYRRYTKPVLVHVPDEAAVSDLEVVAPEFSNIKFIAHGAAAGDWQSCMLAAKRLTNIFLEPFSGGAHRGKLEGILATLGPHRVLFASNFPGQNPGYALGLLYEAKLSDPEKQSILFVSAVRLFGLQSG
jgi:predicted TIM-barrel fold metal-dependent hydrolase